MTRLTNIRECGRYKNTETGKEVNVKVGRNAQRSTDHHFYLYRGKRVFITDNEIYGETKKWVKVS